MNHGFGEVAPQEDDMIKLSEILAILFRNKLLITVVTTLVMVCTVFLVATRRPQYSAKATLL